MFKLGMVSPRWSSATRLMALSLFVILVGLVKPGLCQTPKTKTEEPTKAALIRTLKAMFPLMEKKDYSAASNYFVLPPNFKPEMLDGLIEKREASASGIEVLEKDAVFGSAIDVFGEERAKAFAARASVDVDQCYGFNHETKVATGEVIAFWDGTTFKLIRLDDVGKLESMVRSEAKPEVDKQKISEALPALEAAVEANPEDVTARANYALALYQVGNLPAAIAQLLQARKIQPEHVGINRGLAIVLGEFETKGLFSVGVPMETIKNLLGEPERVVELNGRTRWVYAFVGVDFADGRIHEFVDLRGATEALYHPTEFVSIDLDGRGWQCGIRKKSRDASSAVYYLPGEGITGWKERVDIERRLGAGKIDDIEEITKLYIEQVLNQYPNAVNRVLEKDAESAIVAFVLPALSAGEDRRHVLVRLIKGPVDVHRIAYTIQIEQPSQEHQAKWLGIFKAAILENVEPVGEKEPDK